MNRVWENFAVGFAKDKLLGSCLLPRRGTSSSRWTRDSGLFAPWVTNEWSVAKGLLSRLEVRVLVVTRVCYGQGPLCCQRECFPLEETADLSRVYASDIC